MDRYAPESPENIASAHLFASSFYSGLKITLPVFERCHDMFETTCRLSSAQRDKVLFNLWSRAYVWLLTFEQLPHTRYYQAIHAGERTLIEIAVDVALVHKADADGFAVKMQYFAECEKLRMCEQLVAYFAEKGLPVPLKHRIHEEYIENNKERIDHNREILWKLKASKLTRWTGNNLAEDIKNVDDLYGQLIIHDLEMPLEQFYRSEYRKMNWHIHSGLAGVWEMPAETFSIAAGFALKWSTDLMSFIAKTITKDLGLHDHLPGVWDEWQKLRNQRDLLFLEMCPPS